MEPHEIKYKNKCCVPGCANKTSKRHNFPNPRQDEDMCKRWIESIKSPQLQGLTPQQIYRSFYVCDIHFAPEYLVAGTKRGLRKDAIPTLHLSFLSEEVEVIGTSQSSYEQVSLQPSQPEFTSFLPSTSRDPLEDTAPQYKSMLECLGHHGKHDTHSTRRRFPRRADGCVVYNLWLKQVNNPKLFTLPKSKICSDFVVCDRHFDEDCKIPNYKRLKPGSIPTLFLPSREDGTEAAHNVNDVSIDLPPVPIDSSDTQLVDSEELLLNSDAFELHTVEAQDSFLSSIFKSKKQYDEPQFPVRLPEDESTINDASNNELEEFLYFENLIDAASSDIIQIVIEDIDQTADTEEVGEVETPLPEKPYFKSVKSYLVDSRSITEVCRICFRSILDEEMIKLYEEDHTEVANNIRNMLKLVLPDLDLEMYPNSVICTKCHELLNYSYQLKETWLTTEEKLRNIINKKRGVTNRDADLVIVAKAVLKDKNKRDETETKNDEMNVTKPREKVMQEVLSHNDGTTNVEVSDHGDLEIEKCRKKSNNNNVSDQNICSGQENDAKRRNKPVQNISRPTGSTINLEVEKFAEKSDSNDDNANKNQNISCTRIWGSEQQNGVDENMLGELKNKLKDILKRNDADIGKFPNNNVSNQDIFNKTTLGVGQENNVEIKAAKVTDKVLEGILSHSNSTANLELVIYHADLDCEKSPKQPNRDNVNTSPNETNLHSYNRRVWGLGPYICEVCGKTISNLKALKRHLKAHSLARLKPKTKRKDIMCELCGQLFTSDRTLRMHTEKHARKFNCTMCHKIFTYSKALQLHIKRAHLRQYDYTQCHLCGKQLAYQGSLKMHLLTHNAEKTHVCNICGKRFFFVYSLRQHLRRHTNDMLSCEHCGKALKYKYSLEKHIRIYHKNEAEYRCDFCSRPYWKKVDLTKHKIRVHGWGPELENSSSTQ